MKDPAVDNLACIVKAIAQHNRDCPSPAVAVCMHPIELERLGWDDGDQVASCELRADPSRPTGTFVVVCAKDDVDQGQTVVEAVGRDSEVKDPVHA